MERTKTFAQRLREALDLRSVTQSDLAKRADISKSSITQYLKGAWEAKQDALYALALALDVSEAWLMGYDVTMERQQEKPATISGSGLDDAIATLFSELSDDKKQNVTDYIRFLSNSK